MDIPSPIPTGQLGPFRYWCQRVLPAVYGNELSYFEVLCKVRDKLNDTINILNQQGENVNGLITLYNELNARVTSLENEVDDIKNGKYVELYLDSIIAWIDANLQQLVSRIVKFVCFGLSDDGYFTAYIPATWAFLSFDTVATYDDPDYGKLIIKW